MLGFSMIVEICDYHGLKVRAFIRLNHSFFLILKTTSRCCVVLLDDFKALLWAYGGNLGSGSGRYDPELASRPELFLPVASNFISSDARLATCIFNLVIEMAPRFSAQALEENMTKARYYDVRRLGVLVSIVADELQRRDTQFDATKWSTIESQLPNQIGSPELQFEPLLPHLPKLPGRREPLFLAWGFEYPGIVREPDKYLRKAM